MLKLPTIRKIAEDFADEIRKSEKGQKTSLPYIRQSLPLDIKVASTNIVQVFVIGGSTYQTALVKKTKGRLRFTHVTEGQDIRFATKLSLLTFMTAHLLPQATVLSVSFAFPMTPTLRGKTRDGKLISGTKEHALLGLVGQNIGETIESFVTSIQKRTIQVVVGNDTICTLLSGLREDEWDNLACGIVGTGVNFAITNGVNEIINLESANFTGFPKSQTLARVDRDSARPGAALFEKDTSGAYLYKHFNLLANRHLTSTYELKQLALTKERQDSRLALNLLRRSAGLVASQVAGITLFKKHTMTFIMEGGFFWGEDIYANLVREDIAELGLSSSISLRKIPNGSLLGAARLVYRSV